MKKKGRGRGEAERHRAGEEKSRTFQCAAGDRARERRKKTGRFGRDNKKKKSRAADPVHDQVGAGEVDATGTWGARPQQQIRSGAQAAGSGGRRASAVPVVERSERRSAQ